MKVCHSVKSVWREKMTNRKSDLLNKSQRQSLKKILFNKEDKDNGLETYAVIDAAKESSIPFYLDGLKAKYQCLLKGNDATKLAKAAPYLVKLDSYSGTDKWFISKLYGNNVGFVFKSGKTFKELSERWSDRICGKLPEVNTNGYFRLYDPRVLRDYLSLMEEESELEHFMEFIDCLLVEGNHHEKILQYKRTDELDKSVKAVFLDLSESEEKITA